MSITTVLLDAGGVIVDESEYEQIHGRIITELLAGVCSGYSLEYYFLDVDEAVVSFCPSVYQYIIWKHTKKNIQLFDKIYSEYLSLWHLNKTPFKLLEGIAEEIKLLSQKYKILLAGQYGHEILEFLTKAKILQYFSNECTQDDYNITKPDPRFFERIAASAGALHESCVMVGDRIDKDIIPAEMLGMKTVLIRGGLHRNQQPRIPSEAPDLELSDVRGLAAAIDSLHK